MSERADTIETRSAYLLGLAALSLVPLTILVWTGLRGLDFGVHWDEQYYQIRPVKAMLESGSPLPRYYGYPSFNYWINTAALLPDLTRMITTGEAEIRRLLIEALDSHAFLLRLRALHLIIAS